MYIIGHLVGCMKSRFSRLDGQSLHVPALSGNSYAYALRRLFLRIVRLNLVSLVRRYVVMDPTCAPVVDNEIKRSQFIGYALRVDDESSARSFLADLKAQHRQATHVCHAFVIGPDRRIQRSSDDGEPAGTAGMPILDAIVSRHTSATSCELSDVVLAVVRYFGGIKLGAGGLVQAYSTCAARTLDHASYCIRQRVRIMTIDASYADAPRLETTLRAHDYPIVATDYGAQVVTLSVAVVDDDASLAQFSTRLATWTAGHSDWKALDIQWVDLR